MNHIERSVASHYSTIGSPISGGASWIDFSFMHPRGKVTKELLQLFMRTNEERVSGQSARDLFLYTSDKIVVAVGSYLGI